MKKLNILVNGFGRIGRAILRQISKKNHISKIYINDLNEDITNLIYTYNFDKLVQVYKKFPKIVLRKNYYYLGKKKIIFKRAEKIKNFSKIKDLDLIVDTSGICSNKNEWIKLSNLKPKLKFLYTFDHPITEITLVLGANESRT